MNHNINENNAGNYRINHSKTVTSKHFECKIRIIGSTSFNNNTLGTELLFH